MMDNRLEIYLDQDCLVNKTQPIVVGVSGGADSQALLLWLDQNGYLVIAVYFDHQLRKTSRADARVVEDLARRLKVPFVLGAGDVLAYRAKEKLSIEEAARNLRYQFLFDVAQKNYAQAVAVGHTANDQVETVLMRLIRGSGTKGLGGMRPRVILPLWNDEIPLVRPFLCIWRDEVLDYCAQNDLHPVEDVTNQDLGFFRNKVRNELIPILEEYNPSIKQAVYRMSNNLRDDQLMLSAVDEHNRTACVAQHQENKYTGFYRETLQALPQVDRQRVLMQEIQRLLGWSAEVDNANVRRALEHSSSQMTKKISLVGGLTMLHENEITWLCFREVDLPVKQWPQMVSEQPVKIRIPLIYQLANNWQIVFRAYGVSEDTLAKIYENTDKYTAWMDAEIVDSADLILKTKERGERFSPLGMSSGSLKLSEYMINMKIPERVRKRWPIISLGENIAWVPGFQISEQVRVTDQTQKVIMISLQKTTR